MMQPQILQPSWLSYETNNYHENIYVTTDNNCFSPVESSRLELDSGFPTSIPYDFTDFAYLLQDVQIPPLLEDDDLFTDACQDQTLFTAPKAAAFPCAFVATSTAFGWQDQDAGFWASSPSPELSVVSSEASVLTMETEGDDNQTSLYHLLAALAESTEDGRTKLAEVISRCTRQKANPLGETLERVAYNVVQNTEGDDYLRRESMKNYETAFGTLYQVVPYGKFAHFSANSAIFESIPDDAEAVHVIDFDMGEGVQFPPLIESMAKARKSLRITSVKMEEECTSQMTRRRLFYHAKPLDIKLQIEDMTVEELVHEMKRKKKTGKVKKEWLAFNCIFRLPHMTNRRQRKQAMEFLKIAKELLSYSATPSGIVVFVDGESGSWSSSSSSAGYTSFFNRQLLHYKSLFESMEWHFPVNLTEARIAVESLFLAPHVCSDSWFRDWQENKIMESCDLWAETGLQGRKLSRENIFQAKETVNERETPYRVRIEEEKQHEMILEWRGTPLMTVSTWM